MRCTRSWTNSRSLTVELRAGGFAAGRMPEWAQPRDGYRRIREAYEDNTRLGMLAGGSEVLGYATEALVLAGDWDGAQHELEDALQVADTLGERVYLPQLFADAGCHRARAWRPRGRRRRDPTRDRGGQSAGGTVAGVDGAD